MKRFVAAPLVVGAVLLGASAGHAATNVVTCTPTPGQTSVASVSPAMVNNATPDSKYGIKLATTVDGCVANASQLAAWVPAKAGTPDGAQIAKAAVSVKTKGFGTCNFAAPDAGAYPATGTMTIKWLNSGGGPVASAKASSAFIHLSGDLPTVSAKAQGIVTKGLGMGANVVSSISFDLANPINAPVLACNTGPYAGAPITQIGLITGAGNSLSIDFP